MHAFLPQWGGDAHAGRTETSLQLALGSAGTHPDLAEAGNTASLRSLWSQLRENGVRAVSANGVLGDPTGASAAEGADLLAALSADLAEQVAAWLPATADHRIQRETPHESTREIAERFRSSPAGTPLCAFAGIPKVDQ